MRIVAAAWCFGFALSEVPSYLLPFAEKWKTLTRGQEVDTDPGGGAVIERVQKMLSPAEAGLSEISANVLAAGSRIANSLSGGEDKAAAEKAAAERAAAEKAPGVGERLRETAGEILRAVNETSAGYLRSAREKINRVRNRGDAVVAEASASKTDSAPQDDDTLEMPVEVLRPESGLAGENQPNGEDAAGRDTARRVAAGEEAAGGVAAGEDAAGEVAGSGYPKAAKNLKCDPSVSFESCAQHCFREMIPDPVDLESRDMTGELIPPKPPRLWQTVRGQGGVNATGSYAMTEAEKEKYVACLMDVCVSDYVASPSIPGCIKNDGSVANTYVAHDPNMVYNELDFYNPKKLDFYKGIGYFRLRNILRYITPECSLASGEDCGVATLTIVKVAMVFLIVVIPNVAIVWLGYWLLQGAANNWGNVLKQFYDKAVLALVHFRNRFAASSPVNKDYVLLSNQVELVESHN